MSFKRNTRTTIVASALAVSLLAGGAAVPAGTVHAASAVSFSDVSSGHWAEKHITKLALQGIITGYNGSFRPGESVTRQEAVLMALRFAGLDGEVRTDDVIAFPSSFVVSNFYKAYINLAFEHNLLDRDDEYALAASETDKEWGTTPASREWVTKLLVRAIGEEDKAESMAGTPSSFGDAGSIGSDYVGYVNAAVSLELVKGVSETKFDPQANVNRASLATLFSRAERLHPVEYAGQTSGIVTKLSDSSITVYADGEETTYSIGGDTRIYRYDSEQAATLDDLELYTDVTVIADSGNALYIEAQGDEQHVDSYEAVMDRVIKADDMMYVWVDDKPVEVYYDDSLVVKDGDGEDISLDSIKRDSVITITQDTFRDSPMAVEVTVESQAVESAEGTFYSTDDKLITIMKDGSPITYVLADEVEVEIEGMDDAELKDLIKGKDVVELTMNEDGEVAKVEVTNRDVESITGAKVMSYDDKSSLVTLVDSKGTTPYALFISDNTKIRYNGDTISLSKADSMLEEGRIVSLTYSGSAIVTLEFLSGYTGTIGAIDKSDKELTLKLDNGVTVTVPYSSPSVEIVGDDTPTISDLAVGNKVTVKLTSTQDRAASINVHKDVQYDIVKVLDSISKLQLKAEGEDAIRLDISSVKLLDEDGDEVGVSSYKAGDVVTVSYEGLTAKSVVETPVVMGSISSASASGLTLKTNDGDTETIDFDDDTVTLYVDGDKQSAPTASLAGKYAAIGTDSSDNTVIYVSSGEKRSFTGYDESTGQILTLRTSSSNSDNYFIVRSDTALLDDGASFAPASLSYGDELTVYYFRNTAIAIMKN
ncbi:S-layer homology domain-containing protein [Paenibacillus thailandensis]|uniref:S-layer homology domain-containing protein n=1 Tax=Paenibacillus thailandensis TaxID=393250 RepID=A0ABW5QZT1_9BACL